MSQKTPQDVVDVLVQGSKRDGLKSLHSRCTTKVEFNYAWLDAASFQTQISEQEKYFDELLTRLGLKK
ncbi:hypothetical protein MWG46_13480 [Escherichia coli]|nr:hypothetical protein [Escherichia coli]